MGHGCYVTIMKVGASTVQHIGYALMGLAALAVAVLVWVPSQQTNLTLHKVVATSFLAGVGFLWIGHSMKGAPSLGTSATKKK